MTARQPAKWIKEGLGLYSWGEWYIAKHEETLRWWLIVSSGVEYGPFISLQAAKRQAEEVRGD